MITPSGTPWLAPLVTDYLATLSDCLDTVVADGLDTQVRTLASAVRSPCGTVYAVGNGGSSSTAETFRIHLRSSLGHRHLARVFNGWSSHLVVDAVHRHGFTRSTVRLLDQERLGPDDLVIVISASGNSRNLVAVADQCLNRKVPVLACTGSPGGELAKRDVARLTASTADQQLAEDATHAALYLLVAATKSELEGRSLDRLALQRLADGIKDDLQLDVGWLDNASDAIADAVLASRPIHVVAPEGGTLASAAEHVAHNLMWDMCHDLDAPPPDIRWGISVAHFTGMSNDSPVQSDAMVSLVRHARPDDLMFLFGHDHTSVCTSGMIAHSHRAGVRLFGSFGSEPTAMQFHGTAIAGGSDGYLRALRTQMIGHLLLRAARSKIGRRLRSSIDLAEEERQARLPVAPLLARGSKISRSTDGK
ncbi:SIS domain-containing protein [Streptomyces canus]|uniref:SIS domain-containing protein n=1 Tax=Streptomyces canus TaxID=58343 RepID=UPI0030E163A6